MRSLRVHHVAIVVRDVQTCAQFYRVVLGLEELQAPRPGVSWFRLGDAILMIEPLVDLEAGPALDPEDVNQGTRPGLHLLSLAIHVDERPSWETRLSTHGVAITNRSDYSLYFRDPENNRLALSHYPDKAR